VTATGGFSPFGTLTSPSTLDLSGLSSFTYSNSSQNFTVQGTAAVSGIFNLNLAGSNSITAANIYVGNGGGTSLPTGNLFLGQTNIFNAGNFQLGAYRGSGNVYFESGLNISNVTFRGVTGGSSRLGTMTILSQSSGASQTDTMDLGAANVDALIGTLYVLNTAQPQITETATLNFGNGTFDIATLDLSYVNSTLTGSANSTGSVNQNGGLARVQTLNFGVNGSSGTPIFKPSYTLAAGATLAASNITAAAGVPYNALTIRNLNLNGGTVSNYNATTDLTISGADNSSGGVVNIVLGDSTLSTLNAGSGRAITVQSTAPISGSGNLNKTGAGTLTLVGAHPYTGTTLVSAGTMLVNGALGTNTMTVASGATLGGSGSIGGITTLQSGGTLQPGNASGIGTLTNGTLNLGDSFSAATASRFNIAVGGKISTAALNVSGTHTINLFDASLPLGTNTLITYTGTIGGSGFTGLKLGTVPSLPTGATAYLRNTGSAVQLVVAPPVAPTLTNVVSFGAGGFSLSFSGSSGQSYRVLASLNLSLPLTNWLILTNGFFGTGIVNFMDNATTNQQKFYRVRSP
jgi:autotransporter-associated beta strand protein